MSPYVSGTVTNGEPDMNHATVSGNHGTSGGGGFPTANSVSTSLTIDGVEVPLDGRPKHFEKAELVTVNSVTNRSNIDLETGERHRVDFIETTKYTIEYNHLAVEVELEAVEDFYINWYFGLQLLRNAWRNDAYFNHDLSQTHLYTQTVDVLNSGIKADSPDLERITIRNSKGDVAHVYTDKDYGVGYSKIRNNDPILYLSENFRKVYFHLVKRNNDLIVPKGTTVRYRGGYIFGKNKAVNATSVTYFTENGVKKAYVDFKVVATEPIKYSSVEKSFNCTVGDNSITSTTPNAYAKLII